MTIIKINYYVHEKEKSLKIFTILLLKHTVISSGEEFEFDKSEESLVFLNDIKKCKISLEKAKNLQQDYEKYLKEIQKGNKSAEQKTF